MAASPSLESASLDTVRQRVVERLVAEFQSLLGDHLVAVWLYGSRARGEPPHEDSDVDLMVVTTQPRSDTEAVDEVSWRIAVEEGLNLFALSIQVVDPEWLAGRRRIESFFIAEVDRDKIVLYGES